MNNVVLMCAQIAVVVSGWLVNANMIERCFHTIKRSNFQNSET